MSNSDSTPLTTIDQPNEVESNIPEQKGDSMKEFYQLRNNLLISTISISVVSFILVWCFYSLNTSLNYLLGACFSLVYVNMLAREVEKIGKSKKKIGATRLAIFVGLIIVATQREQLQVIPVFLGFMTYKAAILFYILPSSLLGNLNKSEKNG
ncbi:ATP synthase subunit I [Geminocystis sp. NIES-3709]|uniref:ATP synthase subunit I n=1 Tax=Geminocystis sp. NIES-3709 TaxID=1617448 RepID=UPI0005FC788E|nr:ATP synthase subunit I [Geminocystis sp. NIES-3709]BAQ66553.1 ATP synthase protein I [Geminocystis sp. NIES-3709]